jgi:GPN-loop GTPase
LPELARAKAAREKSLEKVKTESMTKFMKDSAIDRERNPGASVGGQWEEEEGDEEEGDIIDRSWCSFFLLMAIALTAVVDVCFFRR